MEGWESRDAYLVCHVIVHVVDIRRTFGLFDFTVIFYFLRIVQVSMPYAKKVSRARVGRKYPAYAKSRYAGYKSRASMSRAPALRSLAKSKVFYDRQIVESRAVGLGQAARTRLRTFFHATGTLGATGIFAGFLKPGSCFDPCGDMGTLQPNLYDQWKAIYGRYLVIGATVKITVVPQLQVAVGVGNAAGTLCAYPSVNSTAKTTVQDAASQPYAKTVNFGTDGSPRSLYFKLDHKDVVGKWGSLDPVQEGGLVTADPALPFMVLPIFYQSAYAVASSAPINLQIEITQDVWFDRRINVNDVIE